MKFAPQLPRSGRIGFRAEMQDLEVIGGLWLRSCGMNGFHFSDARLRHRDVRRSGQALVETALALPLLILLLVNVINFGFSIYGYITANNGVGYRSVPCLQRSRGWNCAGSHA
jgi:hypothetical protein